MAETESFGVDKIKFAQITESQSGPRLDQQMLAEIPVEATVELGKAKIALREILDLAEGSIISLDKVAGESLDIKVGGQVVAQGEVVAVNDCYAIRVTKVCINK
ncbi:MAG: flagellar motor switch protein FliN [Candidatus Saganbacteria bacterium]|nr:flagellar motor switch protein FliN [Candidatus Saganbacteria bacterium]